MKFLRAALVAPTLFAAPALAEPANDLGAVSPALKAYEQRVIVENLWEREVLSKRDRSIVTLSAIIALQHTVGMAEQVGAALDNGVTPAEISELVTHLAFYSGWGNALAAAPIIADVFAARGVDASDLPAAEVELLPLNEEAEAMRANAVAGSVGPISPGLEQFTTDPLFIDLWLRPDLAPRDRSLVTFSALVALGHTGQIGFHLSRAMDAGLTAEQAGEVIAHLAFYAGWPNAFSAAPVVGQVLERRAQ